MGKKIISYFESRATVYQNSSESWPWKFFRQKEMASIEKLLDPEPGSSMIDIGCGTGFYSQYFKQKFNFKVMGIDSSPSMIKELHERGIEGRLLSIEDARGLGEFDNAIAAGLFEFIEEPGEAIENINSLLLPGGKCVLLIPDQGFFGQLYRLHHQVQGCSTFIREVSYYEQMFSAHGFKLLKTEKPTLISQTMSFEKIR